MNFEQMREWLLRRLAVAEDFDAGAGGTSTEALARDAQARTVTPEALAGSSTELGRVILYMREHRGWSRRELADLADIDESEVWSLETRPGFSLSPRSLVNIARVCNFSVSGLQRLANHVVIAVSDDQSFEQLPFAAQSKNVGTVSKAELDAVRTLVEVLSERAQDPR